MRRTVHQRQAEAHRKFKLAVSRAIRAKSSVEKDIACRWACAWADVARSSVPAWRFGPILDRYVH